MEFKLTRKCNYNCHYCVQGGCKDRSNLSNASDRVVDSFVEFINNLDDCWEIGLVGGEATVHPRFLGFIRRICG